MKYMFNKIKNFSVAEFYSSAKEFCYVFVQSKYSFIRAIVLSMSVVFIYQLLSDPEYTISSTIYLTADDQNRVPSANAFKVTSVNATSTEAGRPTLDVGPLQLKGAARKAISKLNLHVHYFADRWLGKKELYGEDAPITLTLISSGPRIAQYALSIKTIDSATFVLKEGGDVQAFLFGQVVKRPFATFKIMPGPAFEGEEQELVVTFSDPNLMAEQYVDRLAFKRKHTHPDLVTISLKEQIPQRGVDFLNKMTALYAEGYNIHKESYRTAMGVVYNSLDSVQLEIARLDVLLEDYRRYLTRMNEIAHPGMPAPAPAFENTEQAQALNALKLYVDKPVDQITIIPENLDLGDARLQELVKDFNQKQLGKLALLKTHKAGSPLIQKQDKQLAAIQGAIAQRMEALQQPANAPDTYQFPKLPADTIAQQVTLAEADMADIQQERQAKKAQYNYLLERREELGELLSETKHKLLTIHKPEDNIKAKSYFKNYALAFLFGLGMPLFLIKVLKW